jgi:cell division protein ZapD
MLLYEHPFNERVRTCLRVERLLARLNALVARDDPISHHHALTTLFEIMDVGARADLKTDTLKELERQRQTLMGYRGNPAIEENTLDEVLGRIESAFSGLNQQNGKPGQSLQDNEWLMSVRSRAGIPGGTCEFDVPAYYAWQHADSSSRRQDLMSWSRTLLPLSNAVTLLLHLLRDSGAPQWVVSTAGQVQQTLPQGKTFQLLRLRIDQQLGLIPEISGNRLMVSVRLMRMNEEFKLALASDASVRFELALCSS